MKTEQEKERKKQTNKQTKKHRLNWTLKNVKMKNKEKQTIGNM